MRRASAVSILPGRRMETRSLTCPGVCRNLRERSPRASRSPSLTRMSMAPEGASSCMTSFAIVLHLRSRAPETWSAWVWVSIMYAGLSPCLKRRSIIGSTISSSGSLSPRHPNLLEEVVPLLVSLFSLLPISTSSSVLLALVELGQPLAGLPYLGVVRVEAQVLVRFGRQARICGPGVAQPRQQPLPVVEACRVAIVSHDSILPEALPEG